MRSARRASSASPTPLSCTWPNASRSASVVVRSPPVGCAPSAITISGASPRVDDASDGLGDLVGVVGLLGQQGDVRRGRHPGVQGRPAGVAAHHLDDHRPVVRRAGGGEAVTGVDGDLHRGVEAERVVGRRQVVVDRLRRADHRRARLVQPGGHPEGVLAADGEEGVDAEVGERGGDRLQPAGRSSPGWCVTTRGWCRRAAGCAAPVSGSSVIVSRWSGPFQPSRKPTKSIP